MNGLYKKIFISLIIIFALWISACGKGKHNGSIGSSNGSGIQYTILYTSQNLSGHSVAAECNPGGGTNCPCSAQDVAIVSYAKYGEVTSNIREVNTYVNAIGYKKFIETFPNDEPVTLGTYKYTGKVKLLVLPAPNPSQWENSQAVHMMIQLWDGRNGLFESNKTTMEGAIYWELNPWAADYGQIFVYVKPVVLFNTGITLTPDTNWHTFELIVDFVNQKYVSITIDGQTVNLSNSKLAQVLYPTWSDSVALGITTESMAAWPQFNWSSIFTWTTRFKDLEFSLVR